MTEDSLGVTLLESIANWDISVGEVVTVDYTRRIETRASSIGEGTRIDERPTRMNYDADEVGK
jgi:hypothetical protein